MNENTKNMLIAAALSLIFIGLWDYFYAFPEMDKQRKAQIRAGAHGEDRRSSARPTRPTAAAPAERLSREHARRGAGA